MTSLINDCCFRAGAGGLADFAVASAITGFLTPTDADAVDQATYTYRAESNDRTQWEVGQGLWDAGTTTLQRTTVEKSSNSNNPVTFSAAPRVWVSTWRTDDVASHQWFNTYTEVTLDNTTPYDWDGSTYELRITTDGSGLEQIVNFTGTPANGTPYLITLVSQTDPGDFVSFTSASGAEIFGIGPPNVEYAVFYTVKLRAADAFAAFSSLPSGYFSLSSWGEEAVESGDGIGRAQPSGTGAIIVTTSSVTPVSLGSFVGFPIIGLVTDGLSAGQSVSINGLTGPVFIVLFSQVDPGDLVTLSGVTFSSLEGVVNAVDFNAANDYVRLNALGNTVQLVAYSGSGISITPYPSGTFTTADAKTVTVTAGIITAIT